jgi:hypothetical protein
MKKFLIVVVVLSVAVAGFFYFNSSPDQNDDVDEMTFSGFIRDISTRGGFVVFSIDEAEMLSGEEAVLAGIMDTECSRENIYDCIPSMNNDYYIRNLELSETSYKVSKDVSVNALASAGSPVLIEYSIDELIVNYDDPSYYLKDFLFHFVRKNGYITSIEQQYTP